MRCSSVTRVGLVGRGGVEWRRAGEFYRSRGRAGGAALTLAGALLGLAGCAPPSDVAASTPPVASLRDLVEAGSYLVSGDIEEEGSAASDGSGTAAAAMDAPVRPSRASAEGAALRFPSAPRVQRVASGLHWRTAVVTEPGTWTWDLAVPIGGRLHLGVESFAKTGATGDPPPIELTVSVVTGERRKAVRVASPREVDAPDWLDLDLALDRWQGRRVRLEVAARPVGPSDRRAAPAELAWSPARVVAAASSSGSTAGARSRDADHRAAGAVERSSRATRPPPPSILLVVIDTLRADYLSPYGASRWTSPSIARLVAARGVVFENAYAQAPWTLPSMVSLMTGVLPGILLGSQPATFEIPPGQPTVPELLQAAGYETAAFIANPTMHQGNGFGRGLDDLYISPPETAFVTLEDELLVRKASSWLRARGDRPFFAHVHFLAPHDPYSNPVQFLGRSPLRPFYLGRLTGRDVHELFLGTKSLDDAADDVAHLRALYASEVRWVDRWVGELLDAIPPARRDDTLVVVTSDHGEELHEHGGWKHGRTVYEEQLRVPLLVRWSAAIPPRRRVTAPVRLVDVAPTLFDAAGVEAPRTSSSGRSLLPYLLAGEEPEPAEVFVERLNFGPQQVAVVARGKKLVLFDLYAAAGADNAMQERKIEEESRGQPRVAVFDLERDPLETRNLAATAPELIARLMPLVHRGLGRGTPGLRVLGGRIPEGARLDVTLRFEALPTEWRSYFLGGSDGAGLIDRELRLDLAPDVIEKGVLVLGDWRRIEDVAVRLDGAEVAATRVWTPGGSAGDAAPLDVAALSGEGPSGAEASSASPPLLYLWVPPSGAAEAPTGRPSAETLHRLRALGYL